MCRGTGGFRSGHTSDCQYDGVEIHRGVEAEDAELEAVLALRLAVSAPRVATRLGEQGDDLMLERYRLGTHQGPNFNGDHDGD